VVEVGPTQGPPEVTASTIPSPTPFREVSA
jgi:hypothetical protein